MVIQFTLQELAGFLCFVLLVFIGVLLITLLWKINKIVSTCRSKLDENAKLFQQSILPLPGIMQNTEEICKNLKDSSEHLRVALPPLLKDAEYISHSTVEGVASANAAILAVRTGVDETVTTMRKDVSDLMDYFHLASEIIKILMHAFSGKK